MSNRYHSKWHRHNHHTYAHPDEPDSSHDPIASREDPFYGDFILNGALSAAPPLSSYAGYFWTKIDGANTLYIVSEGDLTNSIYAIAYGNNSDGVHAAVSGSNSVGVRGVATGSNGIGVVGTASGSNSIGAYASGTKVGLESRSLSGDLGDININEFGNTNVRYPNFSPGFLAVSAQGNSVFTKALTAGSIWTNNLFASSAVLVVTDMHITELSGLTITDGDYSFSVPPTIDPSVDPMLFLKGIGLSGTSWAAINGDVVIGRGLSAQTLSTGPINLGYDSIASGQSSLTEGYKTKAVGDTSHAAGSMAVAEHDRSYVWSSYGTHGLEVSSRDTDQYLVSAENCVILGRCLRVEGPTNITQNITVSGDISTYNDLYVSGSTHMNCIVPISGNTIGIGCTACLGDIGNWDPDVEFGVRVCGTLSANAVVGLLNHAQTEIELSGTKCYTTPTWGETLWSSSYATWDGLVVLTTEATGSNGYAQVEAYTDNNLVGNMIVGNPGNITDTLISHPLSAERTLENKQVLTFPIIARKSWSVNLIESYGNVCHDIVVYKHVRSVDMTNLWINESLYTGGSAIFVGPVQMQSYLDMDCGVIRNLSAIENESFCVDTIHINKNIHVDTVSGMVIPVGTNAQRSPEVVGSIRYNTDINSFEGYNVGDYWAGLGGVTKVDGNGQIIGTSRAMIGSVTALDLFPPQLYDIWIDTNEHVTKYFDGSDWFILGAAYL